ncbi:MAG: type I restriction enzyme HsdR N-terminal domain-containing protein [Flavobacteriaceae bacterium]|nr:type I restriction enzyme HsdR N-terminal domain-containing protein [Flavobacteriaceae bacterium]MBT3920489.1 type I restriction enzyme HsdR N-terminal domain-containing protein [Flavobacteriaceae bacterium]MBT6705206.1 type I restriction enzyme HsdR N-terminal domain-containing protein [Flavobacteriaceae bacterium]
MQNLNFPKYNFRFKSNENKTLIFDIIRKKFVVLTPEEWVRQHAIHFLISEKKYPAAHINVEKQLQLNDTVKRYDIVVFNKDGTIKIIVECKAPSIKTNQQTFDQIARYNLVLKSETLMVSNGLEHFFCKMDFANKKYLFLKDLPSYQ